MATIALIKPDVLNTANNTVGIPLGPMYLSAVARQAGHEVRFHDLALVRPDSLRDELHRIAQYRPQVVGFTAMSTQLPVLALVSRYLRRLLPDSLFVVGGPFVSSEQEEGLRALPAIDVAVAGEGERAFLALLDWHAGGGALGNIGGILYREGNAVRRGGPPWLLPDLDSLPFPDLELIDVGLYAKFIAVTQHRHRHAAIFTSRGCPYRCAYCHDVFGKHFRARSVENVIGEVRLLRRRHGVTRIEVYDDIFNLDRDRASEILQRTHAEFPDVKFGYPNGLRCDLIDEHFVRLLAKTTYLLGIPVETASERVAARIGRTADLDQIRRVAGWARRYGIYTWGYFMVGFPGETREDMDGTFREAWSLPIDWPILFQVLPFRNTRLADMVAARGGSLPELGRIEYFRSTVNYSEVPTEYILDQRARLWRAALLGRPRNWYMPRSMLSWMVWWLGPAELGWHIANTVRTKLALPLAADSLHEAESFLDRRQRMVFDHLAAELACDQPTGG